MVVPVWSWTLSTAAARARRSDSAATALCWAGPMSRWYPCRARWLAAGTRRLSLRRPRALPPLVRPPSGGLPGGTELERLRRRLQHLRSRLLSWRRSDQGACFFLRPLLRRWWARLGAGLWRRSPVGSGGGLPRRARYCYPVNGVRDLIKGEWAFLYDCRNSKGSLIVVCCT